MNFSCMLGIDFEIFRVSVVVASSRHVGLETCSSFFISCLSSCLYILDRE